MHTVLLCLCACTAALMHTCACTIHTCIAHTPKVSQPTTSLSMLYSLQQVTPANCTTNLPSASKLSHKILPMNLSYPISCLPSLPFPHPSTLPLLLQRVNVWIFLTLSTALCPHATLQKFSADVSFPMTCMAFSFYLGG